MHQLGEGNMIYKCGHCGYIGYCYGIPTSQGVSAPFCYRCGMNNKLEKINKKENPQLVNSQEPHGAAPL